ncbi:hypothetical protein [Rubrivirga sp. IMCC43871]|uniref:hypothetical protein n=1 Tax=Rubrivirga sp. IMCC43871 TaxID=3391575 RepID=UPI00398FA8ED
MFDALPDAARVWLFPLDRDPSDPDVVVAPLAGWLPSWQSHGRPVRAQAAVLADRVLAVAAVISEADLNAGVSGCGIDAMERAVADALAAGGLGLAPALGVAYRDADGAWQHVPRPAFRRMVKAGEAGAETVVLDVTAATVGDLRAHGVERPAGETWAAQAFAL